MTDIQLTPAGHLRWIDGTDAVVPDSLAHLAAAFEQDWRGGWFALAGQRPTLAAWPGLRFWQSIAERYLTGLCHVSPDAEPIIWPDLNLSTCAGLIAGAPPFAGSEYLDVGRLASLWLALDAWVQQTVQALGGLSAFMAQHAPKWHQVGRVYLHLAENKSDPERPFAFMATFTTGVAAGGRVRHTPLATAWSQYANERNRSALLRLLAPVQLAAERLGWLRTMVDDRTLYEPHTWTVAAAYRLLQDLPQLEACGLMVRVPDWWKARPRPKVQVRIDNGRSATLGYEAMLSFDVEVALGEQRLSAGQLEQLLAAGDGLVLFKGNWVEVDTARLRQALAHWKDVEKAAQGDGLSFIEGMRLLAGAPADLRDDAGFEQEREWLQIESGASLRQTLSQLRDPARLASGAQPEGLCASLRPYQREGVAWLRFVGGLGLGACLADDMGLGKTIQVLALLLATRGERAAPALLVVPASLLGNWQAEAARFAPGLRLRVLHPSVAEKQWLDAVAAAPQSLLAECDLVITSYSMLPRQDWLASLRFSRVILDEAQTIKNPQTRQSKAVRALRADARIALTGTPVENRLADLWSLFDFLNPGLLGSASVFRGFVSALEKRAEPSYAPLRQLVSPYLLRRMKTDRSVIADLPPKTELRRNCTLSKAQVKLYNQVVSDLARRLNTLQGIARSGLVLQTLMRLKQICNHPSQLTGQADFPAEQSGKFQELATLCEELAQRQERVLVFTQFREIIDPLLALLTEVFGRPGLSLHGGTPVARRAQLVEQFQADDGPPFMVLSLKAGGTGLTLTAASQVIHFDRWWNPAVENQATDRAFRIGQQRSVLVHKFVTQGTLEERIDTLIADKRQLSEQLLAGDQEISLTELDDDHLLDLLRLDVSRAAI